jgi:hypothetical protein
MTERQTLAGLYDAHRVLAALHVPHGLIGGWAAIAWGRVRATRDVDWLADFAPSKIKTILEAMTPLGAAEWRAPGEDDPIAGLIRVVPPDERKPMIDVLVANGRADRQALERCIEIELGQGPLPAVRPEDIVAMKLQAGGGLDYEDARAILQAQAKKMDELMLLDACRARKVEDRLALLRRP